MNKLLNDDHYRAKVKILFSDFLLDLKSASKHNVWYVNKEIEASYKLACAELELTQPEPSFDNDGLFLRAHFNKEPMFKQKRL